MVAAAPTSRCRKRVSWRSLMSLESVLAAVAEQRAKIARFVPVAFHVHSPQSHDWGAKPGADSELNNGAQYLVNGGEDAFLDHLANEFQIVCITDHMRTGYAARLSKRAQQRGDITVLPGMEVNCIVREFGDTRLHLLAVFPSGHQPGQMDRIFASCLGSAPPDESDRRGQEEVVLHDLSAWGDQIRAQGGMLILAHIDEKGRGHRARFRSTRGEVLGRKLYDPESGREIDKSVSAQYLAHIADLGPDALEIMNPEDRAYYTRVTVPGGDDREFACVVRSDHHHIEAFSEVAAKTYVKVAKRDLESIRKALQFADTRVRYHADLEERPNLRIAALKLASPQSNGLFVQANAAFSDNLTCIIGARGSGKSTILEALRYVLGLNPLLSSNPSPDGGQLEAMIKRTQAANLNDTLIEVVLEEGNGVQHHLSCAYDEESDGLISIVSPGDERRLTPHEVRERFPISLFSWGELESLGRDATLQRSLLDRLSPDLVALKEARRSLYTQLAENREIAGAACRRLKQLIDADEGLLRRYSTWKADFDRANTEEARALFADLDAARDRLDAIDKAGRWIGGLRDELSRLQERVAEGEVQKLLSEMSERARAWWAAEVDASLQFGDGVGRVRAQFDEAQQILDSRRNGLLELHRQQQEKVREHEINLREKTQSDDEDELRRGQREERKARFDRVSDRRSEYLDELGRLDRALLDRDALSAALDQAAQAITTARSKSRAALLGRLEEGGIEAPAIGIALDPGGDRDRVVSFMKDGEFFTGEAFGQYRAKKWSERASRMATPGDWSRALLAEDLDAISSAFTEHGGLGSEELDRMKAHFAPFIADADADVRVPSPRLLSVLELTEQPIDDSLVITLNGRPVDELSPGQRSSTMLPLVALSEQSPLVIDQPEDNLDNRIIGDSLTGILSRLKERRQIVVATHNPNIVVGGDAEQVIVTNALGARSAEIELTGSIESEDIVDAVVSIMEGGAEAFSRRGRRYGLHAA